MNKKIIVLILSSVFIPLFSAKDLIQHMEVHKNTLKCTIHPDIRDNYLTGDFFVEYDEDINLESMGYEVLSLSVVLNLYSLVWFSGENYYVDSMDIEVYDSLEKLNEVFQEIYPESTWSGKIIPRKLVSLSDRYAHLRKNSTTRALLFSGGLDSTSSFYEHKDEDLVMITAWGQFDIPLDNPDGWQGRKESIESLAQSFGQRNSFIRSNYSEIFDWSVVNFLHPVIRNWRLGTIEGMSWAGLTLPILIAKECTHLYIPGGANWYYPVMDVTSPFVEELMEFAGFRLITDQFGLTRYDKAEFIVKQCKKDSCEKPFIKVCYEPNSNCGSCRKCCMTMISLIGLGEHLPDYGYMISDEKAVSNTLLYLKKKMGYFDVWNFKEIQLKLRKYCHQNDREVLEPFLSYDMKTLMVNDRKYHGRCSWDCVKKFNPSITIPENLSEEILAIEV